jgi:uncharacterized membrane protein YsdA (DUF1294 family)/cold shock CspA family protein
MRKQGRISFWNEEKGYGFITPSTGADKVFVHIRAFKNRHHLPQLKQVVLYSLSKDKQGRPCAARVMRTEEIVSGGSAPLIGAFKTLFAIGFMVFVGWSVFVYNMPVFLLYLYLLVSALTFLLYLWDKRAARLSRWRTKESTLHTLALIGGWPGALIAQQKLRHKSRKMSFQLAFWVTVIVNCCAFGWLFSRDGADFLRVVTREIYRNWPF